ncbi:endodeoxyribonuclease [Steccherinum ochraceum]|uniref:DNA topoisomerase (ATP-hydrolyzing) n=1 Tax=Steccherinum ochraceum TaxID=92696 RepID=A0A4R0RJW8_9APHY|nr:endodeoxyribonuclease [Steccherinum ochraceum]
MHQALLNDVPTTKRDVYYKDVTLFKRQSIVDKLVDDIAATMSLCRSDMCIRASPKGLFSGSALTVHLKQGGTLYGTDCEATLIPTADEIARFDVNDDLRWVLVVEKEAIFQTLVHLELTAHDATLGQGIIVTGKGYPDVATRQLVCTLSQNLPSSVPILGLMDADPFGVDILSVYKYGSAAMSHEAADLAAPRLQWIGILNSEFSELCLDRDSLIPMSTHDEKKAMAMLRRKHMPKEWRRELQQMVFTRRKAEIEILTRRVSQVPACAGTDKPEEGHMSEPALESIVHPLVEYVATKIRSVIELQ